MTAVPNNPETGNYAIMSAFISLKTDKPLAGEARKSGMAAVGSASLSLELINWPRLTFVRIKVTPRTLYRRGAEEEKTQTRDKNRRDMR